MSELSGRILLVDDEPPLLKMMGLYLRRVGFTVTVCPTTDQAWEEFQADPAGVRAAVIDASMNGLSMEDLALRILQTDPSVCVIPASGYPVDMSALEAAAPGRVMFLHKPFTPEMLAAAIRRMIGTEEEGV